MKHPRSPKAKGFTLIELLATVAVLGVLAALLLPAVSNVRKKGQEAACTSNMRQLVGALVSYTGENDGYLPPPYQATQPGDAETLPGDERGNVYNSYRVDGEPWSKVYPYITNVRDAAQKIFYCPTMTDTVHGARKLDWNTNWKNSSYYYYFPFDKIPAGSTKTYVPVRLGVHEGGVIALLSDITRKPNIIPTFHDGKGINVGFSDGAVAYIHTEPNIDFYKDVIPGYPTGSLGTTKIVALAKKFKEAREGKQNGSN